MVRRMTRFTIEVPDQLADRIREAAGGDGNVSSWAAAELHKALLRKAVAALADHERATSDPAYEDALWDEAIYGGGPAE
jgi:hypothetical protein